MKKRNYENVWEATFAASFVNEMRHARLNDAERRRRAMLYAREIANFAYVELKLEEERERAAEKEARRAQKASSRAARSSRTRRRQ